MNPNTFFLCNFSHLSITSGADHSVFAPFCLKSCLSGFQDGTATLVFSLSSGCFSVSASVHNMMLLIGCSRNSFYSILKTSWVGRYTPMTSLPLRRAESQIPLHDRSPAGCQVYLSNCRPTQLHLGSVTLSPIT